jgi:hypothetical protein
MPPVLTFLRAVGCLFGGFLFGDEPLHCGQRVGVQVLGDQPGVQGIGLGRPAVVGTIGLVEEGAGAQGVEFLPSELVAGGEPQRGRVRLVGVGSAMPAIAWSNLPGPSRVARAMRSPERTYRLRPQYSAGTNDRPCSGR